MLGSALKIAFRTFYKHGLYTGINVAGLAVGLAACLLMLLFVRDELSYDRFHPDADRIYRLSARVDLGSFTYGMQGVPYPMGPALREAFPEVEAMTRVNHRTRVVVHRDGERSFEEGFTYADASLFEVFGFRLLQGDPATALTEPGSLVVTESVARRYFGDGDPLGETLVLHEGAAYRITGVLEDLPHNSHLQFRFVAPMGDLIREAQVGTWGFSAVPTYVRLAPGRDAGRLADRLAALLREKLGGEVEAVDLRAEPITRIHLYSGETMADQRESVATLQGDIRYVLLFSVAAVLILLVACINYMNLALARAARRVREVGVRKVIGAQRRQLALQFLGEALLCATAAVVLALGLVELTLPGLAHLTGKPLALAYADPWLLPMLGGLILVVTLLAGGYPAFFLSALRPAQALRGAFATDASGMRLRRALIVFQFAVSIALIACTAGILSQLHFLQHKRLGFEGAQVVHFWPGAARTQYAALKGALLQQPGVLGVTTAPLPGMGSSFYAFEPTDAVRTTSGELAVYRIDEDFLPVLEIDLAAGRNLSEASSPRAVLLNETAVREFGLEAPVGQTLTLDGDTFEVIGVVQDFHTGSMRGRILPLLLRRTDEAAENVLVRIAGADLPGTLAAVRRTFEAFEPVRPFEPAFLDQTFAAYYRAEERLSTLFAGFSAVAVLIACLGLFGLVSFAAERRTKEIGIRKALGASAGHIVALLSQDFLRLVLLGFVVATPLAYFAMQRWLEGFAYRITLGPELFLLSGGLALAVACATVGYQALRAALADPARSLRYE